MIARLFFLTTFLVVIIALVINYSWDTIYPRAKPAENVPTQSEPDALEQSEVNILHHAKGKFGPIWVYEDQAQRCITFQKPPPKLVQSCLLLQHKNVLWLKYTRMMMAGLFLHPQPQKILVVGLGGGSLPKGLRTLLPKTVIDTVEIDPAIVDVATKYFDYQTDATTRLFVEDGIDFIRNTRDAEYDIVLLDAFDQDYMPAEFLTENFMRNINRILSKTGVIVMNSFVKSKYKQQELKIFTGNFNHGYSMIMNGSNILLAKKGEALESGQLAYQANEWIFRMTKVGISANQLYNLMTPISELTADSFKTE